MPRPQQLLHAHHRLALGSTPSHGVTSAHAVYWNTSGSGTRYDDSSSPIVRSEQLNYGYIIGTKATSGTAYFASNPTGGSTSPADHIEGVNSGATLSPQSLFLDQVNRRLSPTITFAPNGGSATTTASINGVFGQTYGTLPTTTRAGFVFTGWFTSATGGTLVTASSTIANPADHTLQARWNALPTVHAGADQSIAINQWLPWSPSSIATAAWYDAADATTITATSNAVSLWQDKSGNQNHASQSTSSRRPVTGSHTIGGLNAIAFQPFSDQFLSATHTASLHLDASGGANLFSVFHTTGYVSRGSGLNSIVSKGSLVTAGAGYGIRLNDTSSLTFKASADTLSTSLDLFLSQNLIFSGTRDDASRTASTFINGKQQSTATLQAISSNNSSALILGGESNTARCADVRLGEFLIVPGSLTAHQRQRIEGYLAHKWSLTAQLPVNHLFRSSPPQMLAATLTLQGSVSDAAPPSPPHGPSSPAPRMSSSASLPAAPPAPRSPAPALTCCGSLRAMPPAPARTMFRLPSIRSLPPIPSRNGRSNRKQPISRTSTRTVFPMVLPGCSERNPRPPMLNLFCLVPRRKTAHSPSVSTTLVLPFAAPMRCTCNTVQASLRTHGLLSPSRRPPAS